MLFAAAFKLGYFLSFFVLSTTDYQDVCTEENVSKYHIGELKQKPLKPNGPVEFSMENLLGQMEQLKFLDNEEELPLQRREELLLKEDLFEGDILLDSNYTLRKLLNQDDGPSRSDNSYADPWPDGTVPFAFQDDFSIHQQMKIVMAMKQIQKVSCVQFKIRTTERAYLQFYKSKWCASHVGYQAQIQGLAISDECLQSEAIVLHLLMHVLGFWHEHTRADRHQHICIQWTNIQPRYWCNFRQFHSMPTRPLPYDHNSILHIPTSAFATNKEKPVYTINIPWEIPATWSIQNGLSQIDIQRILDKYDCFGNWQKNLHISLDLNDYLLLNSQKLSEDYAIDPLRLSGRLAKTSENIVKNKNTQSTTIPPQATKSSPKSGRTSSISPLGVKQRPPTLPKVQHQTASSASHLLQSQLQFLQPLCSFILIIAVGLNRFFNLA